MLINAEQFSPALLMPSPHRQKSRGRNALKHIIVENSEPLAMHNSKCVKNVLNTQLTETIKPNATSQNSLPYRRELAWLALQYLQYSQVQNLIPCMAWETLVVLSSWTTIFCHLCIAIPSQNFMIDLFSVCPLMFSSFLGCASVSASSRILSSTLRETWASSGQKPSHHR